VAGLLDIVRVRNSRKMLRLIYHRMDVGNDHLGRPQSDDSLSYVELVRKISEFRPYPAPTEATMCDDFRHIGVDDIPNLWRPPGANVDLCRSTYMPI